MQRPKLDAFDRQLLDLLQRDADLTANELAERVALSPSAIQRRIKQLKASGIIETTIAVVSGRKLGHVSTFLAGLELERERPAHLAPLRAWIAAEPAVQQAFYVTGSVDFMLVVTAPSVAAYERIMSRLLADNANVRRYTTHAVLGVEKRGLYLPPEPTAAD